MKGLATRDQIIEVADKLFYEKGFESTSFADIAEIIKISRGNFYHHFKSKDEILDAVIEYRLTNTRNMLNSWESEVGSPKDRILSFINILIMNIAKIKFYGCPVGTLCTELAKLNHPAQTNANKLFTLFREWLKKQFRLAGHSKNADEFAMYILGMSQGVATLGSAFQDEKYIRQEVGRMTNWLEGLK
ncbi:TetR/AcrR family transcriptional regulator [Leptospira johnsonii]|uniref:TetR family transcriptional regulator n=1 Tax=Leptospira johnsonii TaxID=1917820 RepID=A0A2P2D2F3_9LEPT|nr:TetR/AcrR family transcriptional regulator [Leptospira johnsonii]GBF38813.1 TetR family transcriptional regulator [Leptospira johnsonii]